MLRRSLKNGKIRPKRVREELRAARREKGKRWKEGGGKEVEGGRRERGGRRVEGKRWKEGGGKDVEGERREKTSVRRRRKDRSKGPTQNK